MQVKEPPIVGGRLPLLGHMIAFGKNPFQFMMKARREYGEIVEFRMFHQRMILLTGEDASAFFYRGTDDEFDQSAAYKLMTPIFGEGVVFDAPQEKKDQQLKMLMPALRDRPMRTYSGTIVREVEEMLAGWAEAGEADLVGFMKQLTVYTSSHCLLGPEFRYELNDEFAQIYRDLEGGVRPIAYIHPNLPLPAFRKRDRARRRLQQLVTAIIENRAAKREKSTDMFQMLIDTRYEDGSPLSPHEITGMLIAAIFAGHHTSSGTAAWVLIELLKRPELLASVKREIDDEYGVDGEVTFDSLRRLVTLENVLKEVLRLHPPLIILMRKVLRDMKFKDYTIKAGRLVCAAPPVTHRVPELFPNPEVFDAQRYSPERGEDQNLNAWQAFGGGKHKCSGNAFALFQIKTIFATLLRRYEFELVDPPDAYRDDYTQTIVQPAAPCRVRYRLRTDLAGKIERRATSSGREEAVEAGVAAGGACPFSGASPAEFVTVEVDEQLCQGHAVCMGEAPEVFQVDEKANAKAGILVDRPTGELVAKAKRAEKFCPNHAIKVRSAGPSV
jgi:sterol 14-demethylase